MSREVSKRIDYEEHGETKFRSYYCSQYYDRHGRGVYGSNAAATRRPSSASKLYVEHAFLWKSEESSRLALHSQCIGSRPHRIHDVKLYSHFLQVTSYTRRRKLHPFTSTKHQDFYVVFSPAWLVNWKFPNAPGFGTTVSNTLRCSRPQPSHRCEGTFHKKTLPSRKMHADGRTSPSASWIPADVMELTCTGGGTSPASMFVNAVGRSTCRIAVVCMARRDSEGRKRFMMNVDIVEVTQNRA